MLARRGWVLAGGAVVAAVLTGCVSGGNPVTLATLTVHKDDHTIVPITEGTGSKTLTTVILPDARVGVELSCTGGKSVQLSLPPSPISIGAACSTSSGGGSVLAGGTFPATPGSVSVKIDAPAGVRWSVSIYRP